MTTTPTAAARVSGTIDRIARELCVSENEIWDEATQGYRDRWHGEAARILAAIQPDPEPQPVAWRYRSVVKPTCWSNVTEYRRTAYARIGMEEQPLYATPSSAGTVSVEAAALESLADEMHETYREMLIGKMPTENEVRAWGKALRALAGEE